MRLLNLIEYIVYLPGLTSLMMVDGSNDVPTLVEQRIYRKCSTALFARPTNGFNHANDLMIIIASEARILL